MTAGGQAGGLHSHINQAQAEAWVGKTKAQAGCSSDEAAQVVHGGHHTDEAGMPGRWCLTPLRAVMLRRPPWQPLVPRPSMTLRAGDAATATAAAQFAAATATAAAQFVSTAHSTTDTMQRQLGAAGQPT